MAYGFAKTVDYSVDEARQRVIEELKNEGFGILTEINIKETLKKKLDVDHPPYVILGACNPPLAYKALQHEEEIGLLLPCNVIVYENSQGDSVVSAIEPDTMMSIIPNDTIKSVATEVKQKLHNVIDRV